MAEMKYYAGPAYEESVSAVTASPSVELGSRRDYKGEEYVYVQNVGGSSINAGYGVAPATAASGYSVVGTALTDTQFPLAGMVKHSTLTTDAYGWVLTRGYMNVVAGASALTGDRIQIGGQKGITDAGIAVGLASGPGTIAAAGFGLNANTAAGGTLYAFIKTGF